MNKFAYTMEPILIIVTFLLLVVTYNEHSLQHMNAKLVIVISNLLKLSTIIQP